jgi:PAS domain S-box-containing protein
MNDSSLKAWLHNELFELTPNNIAVIDRGFQIVEANGNFKDEFGEWGEKLCYQMFRDRKKPCHNCKAELVFNDGKRRVGEEQRLNIRGKNSYYVVNFDPIIDDNGNVAYIVETSRDITETRMLQREHDILFDRVPCYVIVLDREMTIVRNNELFRNVFGESIGKKCYEAYHHRFDKCRNCLASRTFLDGGIYSSEMTGVDKWGRPLHYYVTTAPLSREGAQFSHVIEMSLDFTATKVLEQHLKQSADFQEALIQNAIDGIVAADSEGKINIFNPSAEKIFKKSSSELIGKKLFDRMVPKEFIESITSDGGHIVLDNTIVTDYEDENVPVRFSGVVLNSDDKYIGSAGFFQDLTEVKRLENEKLMAERLAAVGQTVAGLAHGIKNVLMGLEGGLYVMKSGMRKENKELTNSGWNMLQDNIERITTYVKDFLNFAKGGALKLGIEDPNKIAQEVLDLFADMAHQSGVNLVAEFQNGIDEAVMDHEGIHTCLTNLVSNAIDACEMSEKNNCSVHFRTIERDRSIIFEVQDEGCGMDYEVKKKVFTTFFSTKGTQKGTGLGLLVTRRIAMEHGGKVTLDSTEGKGSTFRLVFPRNRLPDLTQDNSNDNIHAIDSNEGGIRNGSDIK